MLRCVHSIGVLYMIDIFLDRLVMTPTPNPSVSL